jgi:hypothetical protein
MYVVQYTNGVWKQTTAEIAIGSSNPLKRFVVGSGYDNEDRRCWLDNVFIYTKKGDYNTTANITLSFKDNEDNDISSLYTGTAAFTPEKGSTFTPYDYYPTVMYDDDNKYTYTSGGDAFEVTTDREVELVYTKSPRPTYTLTVNQNYGAKSQKLLDEVTIKEAADYTYYYPRFILDGNTLYEYASSDDPNASATYWTSTLSNVSDNAEYNLTYNAIEGDCVYFSEGEDVEGAIAYTALKQYMSGGSSAVFESGTTLTTLGAGIYKATMRSLGRTNGDRHTYLYKNSTDGELIIHKVVSSNSGTDDSVVFSLDGSTDIVAQGGHSTTSANGAGIDYVYIMKLPSNVEATLGANGYATFASPYALDLTDENRPVGLKAYKATLEGTTLSFEKLNQTVPAGTGLLLLGEDTENPYEIKVVSSGTAVENNALVGVTSETSLRSLESGSYYFVMKKASADTDALTFAPLSTTSSVTIPAGKAYVAVSSDEFTSSPARSLAVSFIDDVTGINTVDAAENHADGIYNLNGQRVVAPSKGLYIMNGKKVIMK